MLSATESRVLGLSSETHQSVRNKPGIARLIGGVSLLQDAKESVSAQGREPYGTFQRSAPRGSWSPMRNALGATGSNLSVSSNTRNGMLRVRKYPSR
jgi:hypothetical protein